MQVTGATDNTTAAKTTNSGSSTSSIINTLGKDDFFKLLITQFKYQNPLEPMDNTEYISQLANFSSLEQMNNLNTTVTSLGSLVQDSIIPMIGLQQAAMCLGQKVEYVSGEQQLSGIVKSVSMQDGMPILVVNGEEVPLSSVISLSTSSTENE
ncbi:MAG: flagellar hook capping FlgD N-terminal domain-containing protein [Chitinophagales bacterium]